jgi:hypothetical protein
VERNCRRFIAVELRQPTRIAAACPSPQSLKAGTIQLNRRERRQELYGLVGVTISGWPLGAANIVTLGARLFITGKCTTPEFKEFGA